jgi:hypothetical protein
MRKQSLYIFAGRLIGGISVHSGLCMVKNGIYETLLSQALV